MSGSTQTDGRSHGNHTYTQPWKVSNIDFNPMLSLQRKSKHISEQRSWLRFLSAKKIEKKCSIHHDWRSFTSRVSTFKVKLHLEQISLCKIVFCRVTARDVLQPSWHDLNQAELFNFFEPRTISRCPRKVRNHWDGNIYYKASQRLPTPFTHTSVVWVHPVAHLEP